jgi:integrase
MTPAQRRRQWGTGSITQRKDGYWLGRIEAGYYSNGTRRQINVVRKTRAEVVRGLKEKQRQIILEGIPEAGIGHATVKTWAAVWLARHQKAVRPRVFVNDRGNVHKWIVPTIGHRRLDQLTPGDVRAVRTAVVKAGRSTTTARNVHWTLMGMLKAAQLEGHQVTERVLKVEAPVPAVSDRDAIPLDDALKILTAAMERPDRARWVASFLQAMRQGEVLGLTWTCVDFDRNVIDVSWQLQTLPYVDARDKAAGFIVPDGYEHRHLTKAWHLVRPKTARGQRVIPLVPWMSAALREWRGVAPENPWGLIWSETDSRGNPQPVKVKDDRDRWKALQVTAGVQHASGRPFEGHEMRHATISWLVEAGVPISVIEALVGHATLVRAYVHTSDAQTRAAVEVIATKLGLGEVSALPGSSERVGQT